VCANECPLNATRCDATSGQVLKCGVDPRTGCRAFLPEETCGQRQTCQSTGPNGAACLCAPGCQVNTLQCSGTTTQQCRVDEDGCTFLGTYANPCADGQFNQTFGCVNEFVLKCVPLRGGQCLEERREACPQGLTCKMLGPGNYGCG